MITQKENDDIIWKKLLTNINEYIHKNQISDFLPNAIYQGLSVYYQFPGSEQVALFLLNDYSMEFEHRSSIPPDSDMNYDIENVYNFLINNNSVGFALDNSRMWHSIKTTDSINDKNLHIIPLIGSTKIIGLVLVIQHKYLEIHESCIKFLEHFNKVFALNLENLILNKKIKQDSSLFEQKLAQRTLSIVQSKKELEAIFKSVQNGILVIDPKTDIIIMANPVAETILHSEQNHLIGALAKDFFFKSDYEYFSPESGSKSISNFESNVINKFGNPVPVIRTASLINLSGQDYRIESFVDITERKLNETALRQANELLELKVQERTEDLQILVYKLKTEIKEREKAENEVRNMLAKEKELGDMKTKFVSMVSHEFRTPLTIIKSAAQILERYSDKLKENERIDYLGRIVKTVDTMTDLIGNVIFIGKSDSDRLQFTPHPLDLNYFCNSIVRDMQLINGTKHKINTEFNLEITQIIADEILLRHIIFNLLSNAFKYSVNNEDIEFKVKSDNNFVSFVITDHGIGIPEKEQDKIFEVFHRASNVGAISGTGLGLSVVVRSLELHKGNIKLQSKEGVGSTFTVNIPCIISEG